MNIVALIPSRANSKRVPGKNTKLLGGKPLIQWTIEAAKASAVFSEIILCSDDYALYELATDAGISWCLRQPAIDSQADIEWVKEVLPPWKYMPDTYTPADAFAILRPTSPFRTADTIRRAVTEFQSHPCDSLRAIEPVKQHPFKMWIYQTHTGRIVPFPPVEWAFKRGDFSVPAHSCPTQTLPLVYAQNSSLEIAWTRVARAGSIGGELILPFFTEGWEGFSIDYPEDWERAERHVADLQAAAAKV